MERLQKVIAEAGVASRRKAEKMIAEGKVKVNGKVIKEMGFKVSAKDVIEIDNNIISKEEKEYYLLNKPRGVVSTTSDDKNRKSVIDYINTDKRIYPVGRLDYDTTGVLLLTNDGEFSNILMQPKNKIDKVYLAKVKGIINTEAIMKLKKGIKLDGELVKAYHIKKKKVNVEQNTSLVELTIHEGKNHQVKRMLEAVNYPVIKLTRERVDIFDVKNLKSGEYRRLTPKEVQVIYSYKK